MKINLFLLVWAGLARAWSAEAPVPAAPAAPNTPNSNLSACAVDARMLRYPDVSATQIAFVYAGDIWVAPTSEACMLQETRTKSFPSRTSERASSSVETSRGSKMRRLIFL